MAVQWQCIKVSSLCTVTRVNLLLCSLLCMLFEPLLVQKAARSPQPCHYHSLSSLERHHTHACRHTCKPTCTHTCTHSRTCCCECCLCSIHFKAHRRQHRHLDTAAAAAAGSDEQQQQQRGASSSGSCVEEAAQRGLVQVIEMLAADPCLMSAPSPNKSTAAADTPQIIPLPHTGTHREKTNTRTFSGSCCCWAAAAGASAAAGAAAVGSGRGSLKSGSSI